MKKLLITATLAAAFCANSAFAQSENFKGVSIGLGVNVANTTVEANVKNGISSSGSSNDYNLALQLQYNVALSNTWLLGVGGSVNLGDLKAGSLLNKDYKEKNTYSLYVTPGYAFSNTAMGYAKLAVLSSKVDGAFGSTNFDSGFGLGFGVQAKLDKNWFGQVEYMSNKYDDKSFGLETDKLKSDVLTFTAGYKF
jgi:opacity protein-like surface antigen